MTNQGHILILGDSVFDNTVYIGDNEKDGESRLLDALPNYHHTFLALVGAITERSPTQLKYVDDAVKQYGPITDLIMSVGGNNLLGETVLLEAKTRNLLEGLSVFRTRQEKFSQDYLKMLRIIKSHVDPKTRWHILGIYYPCFSADQNFPNRGIPSDMHFQNVSRLGVDLFNSVIKEHIDQKDYIDLNHMFNFGKAKKCYANPIEPSSEGSRVIAQFIKPRIEGNSII